MPNNESKIPRSSLNDLAPNNSDKANRTKATTKVETGAERKKLAPIVKGQVVKQKKNAFIKFKEAFFGESDSQSVGDYILYDVLVPAFRDTLSDMGYGLINRVFGGGGNSRRSSNGIVRDRGKSYISYNTIVNDNHKGRDDRRDLDRGARTRHEFDNVIFTERGEAEDVLSHLVDLTIEYGEAPVRAFYELSNIETSPVDENYGWTNLRDAYVDRTRNGHVIVFPPTKRL